MDEVTHVLEVDIFDSDLSKGEVEQLQRSVLEFVMAHPKVGGAGVSGYIGDMSVSRLTNGNIPRGIDCTEGVYDEKHIGTTLADFAHALPKWWKVTRSMYLGESPDDYGDMVIVEVERDGVYRVTMECRNYHEKIFCLQVLGEGATEDSAELYDQYARKMEPGNFGDLLDCALELISYIDGGSKADLEDEVTA